MRLIGTLVKLESRYPKLRYEWDYFPDSKTDEVAKFQIAGPWRSSESEAAADGKKLEKIATKLADQLLSLRGSDLDTVIAHDSKKRKR